MNLTAPTFASSAAASFLFSAIDYFMAESLDKKNAEDLYGNKQFDFECYEDEDSVDENGNGAQQNACCDCPKYGQGSFSCNEGSTVRTILVNPGYWRNGRETAEIWDCEHEFACTHPKLIDIHLDAENKTDPNRYCKEGYGELVGPFRGARVDILARTTAPPTRLSPTPRDPARPRPLHHTMTNYSLATPPPL